MRESWGCKYTEWRYCLIHGVLILMLIGEYKLKLFTGDTNEG